jgi:hypothetical protein
MSMKKLFGAAFILLLIYIVFFDLQHGTLPAAEEVMVEEVTVDTDMQATSNPFFEVKVKAGDTVLSIVENNLGSQIPVSIEEIVNDFTLLNDGTSPEKIQIGKMYRFPDYSH